MIYIVPTRGRPRNARALLEAWASLSDGAELIFVIDRDDPRYDEYIKVIGGARRIECERGDGGMVYGLNIAASHYCAETDYLGFMGDDHRPRTAYWDMSLRNAMITANALIGYGDDLIQGRNLPTAVLMRADVIRTLGFMAPPVLKHLYVDNYWRSLGERTGRITYAPHVVIEHVHPIAGKAEWDEGYVRVNDGGLYAADSAAYGRYVAEGLLDADADMIRSL